MGNIFLITHKLVQEKYDENLYIPLQVGKKISDIELGYISDDTKTNIANKNLNYCELTGIYWLWKNWDFDDWIGISHYRRFFRLRNKNLNRKQIDKIMSKYDIILPRKFYFKNTVWNNYYKGGAGKEKDLKILREVIKSQFPEYLKNFDYIMKKHSASYCNMFVMKKNEFYEYCNWLFKILFLLEKKIDISKYTRSEARIYGYMSEILLNVWVNKNMLKTKKIKIVKTDSNLNERINWNIERIKGVIIGGVKDLFV